MPSVNSPPLVGPSLACQGEVAIGKHRFHWVQEAHQQWLPGQGGHTSKQKVTRGPRNQQPPRHLPRLLSLPLKESSMVLRQSRLQLGQGFGGPWSPSLPKIKNLTMKKIMKKAGSRLETQALSLPRCISMATFKWVILCTSVPLSVPI